MMGRNVLKAVWNIIPKLSLLPLLIGSTAFNKSRYLLEGLIFQRSQQNITEVAFLQKMMENMRLYTCTFGESILFWCILTL